MRADVHLAFCAKLDEEQHRHGRYFLHEHLAGATSWGEASIKKVMNMCGVDQVILHQCQVGQDDGKGNSLKKQSRLISDPQHMLQQLDRRCAGGGGACSRPEGGRHGLCNGMAARRAATYPFKMCRAILAGLREQFLVDSV